MKNFVYTTLLALCFGNVIASTSNNTQNELERLKKEKAANKASAAYEAGKYEQEVKDQASAALHKTEDKVNEVKQKAPGFFRKIGDGFKKIGRTIKDSTKAVFHKLVRKRKDTSLAYKAGKLEQSVENSAYAAGDNAGDTIAKLGESAKKIAADKKDSIAYKAGKLEQNVEDKASSAYHKVRDEVARLAETGKEKAEKAGKAVKEKASAAREKISDKIDREEKAARERLAREKTAAAKIAAVHDAIEDEIAELKKETAKDKKKCATAHSADGLAETAIVNNQKQLAKDSHEGFTAASDEVKALQKAGCSVLITSAQLEQAILDASIDDDAKAWFLTIIKAYPLRCATIATIIATTTCTAVASELPAQQATEVAIASAAIMAVALDLTGDVPAQ